MTETIQKSMYLPADRSTVWSWLTSADKLEKWFHPPKTDLAEGEDYLLTSQKDGDRMCWGTVQEMRPVSYMRWSFTVGPANGAMSTVEWQLDEAPGGTKLSLTHSGLPDSADGFGLVLALDKGWHGFLMTLRENQDALAVSEVAA